mgnify:CR=1 FL=1
MQHFSKIFDIRHATSESMGTASNQKELSQSTKKTIPAKNSVRDYKKEQLRTSQHKKIILKSLEKTYGIVTEALRISGLKISRRTIYEWLKNDPEFAQARQDAEEKALDLAEKKLIKRMQNEDMTALIFYLKCKGKSRGYIDRQEIKVDSKFEITQRITKVQIIHTDSSQLNQLPLTQIPLLNGNGTTQPS